MRRIFHEADNPADQLLVLGLGAWGLRPDEVASLHVSQFVFDTENDDGSYSDDYIEFEERKNGPGTVNLMFGVDAVQDRIADLEGPGWNGYLFPSSQSSSGHRTGETINNRFKRLATAVDVTVDGETPTAKMGRRLWYTMYKNAVTELAEELEEVAADQGPRVQRLLSRITSPNQNVASTGERFLAKNWKLYSATSDSVIADFDVLDWL